VPEHDDCIDKPKQPEVTLDPEATKGEVGAGALNARSRNFLISIDSKIRFQRSLNIGLRNDANSSSQHGLGAQFEGTQ
jgi:hypothetical protein